MYLYKYLGSFQEADFWKVFICDIDTKFGRPGIPKKAVCTFCTPFF